MKLCVLFMIIGLGCLGSEVYGQPMQNLLTNGSFNGTKGEDSHAEGWITGSTPDLNDANGPLHTSAGYSWIHQPQPSNNGGTWQNLYSNREFLQQEVQLEPGKIYTLQFEYAAQGIEAPDFNFSSPAGIEVYINDSLVFKTPNDPTQYTWENACFTFIAQTTVHSIRFCASADQYVGIDGATLYKGNFCARVP
jgi:hypothetical protein